MNTARQKAVSFAREGTRRAISCRKLRQTFKPTSVKWRAAVRPQQVCRISDLRLNQHHVVTTARQVSRTHQADGGPSHEAPRQKAECPPSTSSKESDKELPSRQPSPPQMSKAQILCRQASPAALALLRNAPCALALAKQPRDAMVSAVSRPEGAFVTRRRPRQLPCQSANRLVNSREHGGSFLDRIRLHSDYAPSERAPPEIPAGKTMAAGATVLVDHIVRSSAGLIPQSHLTPSSFVNPTEPA